MGCVRDAALFYGDTVGEFSRSRVGNFHSISLNLAEILTRKAKSTREEGSSRDPSLFLMKTWKREETYIAHPRLAGRGGIASQRTRAEKEPTFRGAGHTISPSTVEIGNGIPGADVILLWDQICGGGLDNSVGENVEGLG